MIVVRLPWKHRKLISDVAKLYCDMAINNDGFDERIRQFWRISMYVKIGLLSNEDARDMLTALESFSDSYKENPAMDPAGEFKGLDIVISEFRTIVKRKDDSNLL